MLGMQAQHPFKVTLISPARTATYSGLLPAVVAGHESPLDLEIDLEGYVNSPEPTLL
jgi:hypothetical protein